MMNRPVYVNKTNRPPIAFAAAMVGLLVWYAVLSWARPQPVADEAYHVPAIRALARGDWQVVRTLPMPATYHWVAALPVRWLGGDLWVMRGFNVLLSVVTWLFFWSAADRDDPTNVAGRLLRFAWHPLLCPLWVLVYTDLAGLLAVIAALAFYLRRQHVRAATAVFLAGLVRQSNVVWCVWLALSALWEQRGGTAQQCARTFTGAAGESGQMGELGLRPGGARVALPYVAALLVSSGLLAAAGAFGGALWPENRPRFNPAQFYCLSLTVALLWLPIWLPHLAAVWPRWLATALLRPRGCALLIAAVGVLELAFRNPHPWNADLNYLRNWALVGLTRYSLIRYLGALTIVALLISLSDLFWHSRQRRRLLALWATTCVFLGGHYLVDPRYYVVPLVLLDFFAPLTDRQARQLTVWYLLLSLGVAAFIVLQPGGWNGVW